MDVKLKREISLFCSVIQKRHVQRRRAPNASLVLNFCWVLSQGLITPVLVVSVFGSEPCWRARALQGISWWIHDPSTFSCRTASIAVYVPWNISRWDNHWQLCAWVKKIHGLFVAITLLKALMQHISAWYARSCLSCNSIQRSQNCEQGTLKGCLLICKCSIDTADKLRRLSHLQQHSSLG